MASVFIGADSFFLHVASTTDTPSIGLFTCTHPGNILSLGAKNVHSIIANVPCSGCHARQKPPSFHLECPENNRYECTKVFDADEVCKKAVEVAR